VGGQPNKKPASAFAKTGSVFFHALAKFVKRLQADLSNRRCRLEYGLLIFTAVKAKIKMACF
jgi:hypothetical protein